MTTMSRRVEGVEKYWDAKFTSGTRLLVMCKVTGTGSMRSSDVARYYLLLNRSMLCCRLSDLSDSESIRGKKVGSPRVVSSHSVTHGRRIVVQSFDVRVGSCDEGNLE